MRFAVQSIALDRQAGIAALPAFQFTYVSSRLVKEVFHSGGDVARLVPSPVLESLKARLPVTVSG